MICGCADFLASSEIRCWKNSSTPSSRRVAAAAAGDPDGYVNTYTQLMEPNHRWGLNGGNPIYQHDLYNAGALVEAGVHYCLATSKNTLLAVAVRFAITSAT